MKQRIFQKNFQALWHSIECLAPEHRKILWSCFWQYELFTRHLIKHRGLPSAIRVLKEIHVVAKGVSMGIRRRNIPYEEMFMKTTSSGIPRALRKLHLLLISRHETLRRCALSVSAAYLLLTTETKESLESIVSPYTGVDPSEFIHIPGYGGRLSGDSFVREPTMMMRLLIRFTKWFIPRWLQPAFDPDKDIHIFSGFRAGPYGTPSFRYAPRDAYTLLSEEFSGLLTSCLSFAEKYGGKKYRDRWLEELTACKEYFVLLYKPSPFVPKARQTVKSDGLPFEAKRRVAKVSFLAEKGGKTRIITSANFWIQKLLFPFHHEMMNILGRIPNDYSFDQERCGATLSDLLSKVTSSFSYDMKGATDRFPLWYQALCLNCFKPGLGTYWAEIMRLPVYRKRVKKSASQAFKRGFTFHYKVGQPMGIYSSWPVFAFCHHVLLRFCVWAVGLSPFSFLYYLLLGDDITILHRRVARCYYFVLTKVLGVGISTFKSYTFPSSDRPGAEFAKRNFCGSQEVSPLSPSMLLSLISGKDPSLVKTLVDRIINRWHLKISSHSSFVCELFKRVLPLRRRNTVMTWFLSPRVIPANLVVDGRLAEIKEEWFPDWESEFGLVDTATRRHRSNLIEAAEKNLRSSQSLLRKLYSFPKGKELHLTMSPFLAVDRISVKLKAFSEGGFIPDSQRGKIIHMGVPRPIPYHPLQAVMQKITTRLEELKSAPWVERDLYRILTLLKHYTSFFKGKVVRGHFYSQVNRLEVLKSFEIAKKVKKLSEPIRLEREYWE